VDVGLLHSAGEHFRFHPLLRSFLRRKLEVDEPVVYRELAARAIDDARTHGRWQEAFELATACQDLVTALEVVEEATSEFLAAGRIETLERWLDECGLPAFDDPAALVTRSQVLVRKGRFAEASTMIEGLIRRLPETHRLAARAANVAGLSRYLSSDTEGARYHYERANVFAREPDDKKDALWGAFVSTADVEVESARPYLDALEEFQDDLNIRLRIATGRQVLASHTGSLAGIWDAISPMIPLASRASDPVVGSNFLAQAGYLALARTDYSLAIQLTTRALEVSQALRHDFAIASCLAYRAASQIGCRRIQAARRDLGHMAQVRATEEDPYLQTEYDLMLVRIALAEGDLTEARRIVDKPARDSADPATLGEWLGIRAIVLAATDAARAAAEAAQDARRISRAVEARFYSAFADAIRKVRMAHSGRSEGAAFRMLLEEAERGQFLESFVIAYRAHPELLKLAIEQNSDLVLGVLGRAHDHTLAKRMGIRLRAREGGRTEILTPREKEVFMLLGEGLSNADIAARLFISRSTTKVHVHNILSKLGLRSRLQAAILARSEEPVE
jgi:ATP/maltotriose-dependent transcriptional regulator MalT